MKKLIITFIAIFLMIAVGLACLMAYAINSDSDTITFGRSNAQLVNTQTINLDEIDTVNISYFSDDVILYASSSDELILKEYRSDSPEDHELADITKNGSKLTINSGKRNSRFHIGIMWSTQSDRVEIYLPAKYLGKLNISTSSGNIVSDLTLTLSELATSSTSGNIKINEVYADRIKASASSGNITFEIAEGIRQFSTTSGNIKVLGGPGDSDFNASSGNITVEKASGHLKAEASSGNLKIINSVGGGRFETSSGNIKLELSSVLEDVEIHASSGDVSVILPDTSHFNFSSQTSSGDIRTFFDDELSYNKKGNVATGTIGDNADLDITIVTSSGNIRINEH